MVTRTAEYATAERVGHFYYAAGMQFSLFSAFPSEPDTRVSQRTTYLHRETVFVATKCYSGTDDAPGVSESKE
jgi:hypothetical protein